MIHTKILVVVLLAAVLISPADALAEPDVDALEQRLQQAQAEIERLREDQRKMRRELEELRVQSDDNWLSERRAEEIRSIVLDVLADADTRASLADDGLMAGWRDGFFLASADGRFSLQLAGMIQARYVYNYHDQPDRHLRGFEVTRTRLTFRGHVFDRNLTYLVRGGFSPHAESPIRDGDFELLDAWVRYHFNDEISIRFGQFKLPFSREYLISPAHQLAVERSVINRRMNLGRSTGIEFMYVDSVSRFAAAYSDGATDNLLTHLGSRSVTNPAQTTSMNVPALVQTSEYAGTVRYEHLLTGSWEQFHDFTSPMGEEFGLMLGIAGHIQRDPATGQPDPFGTRRPTRWYGYTIDASVEFGGANLFGAFTHHYVEMGAPGPAFRDNINIFGVVLQGGVFITPKVEVFSRFEYGRWAFDVPAFASDFQTDLYLVTAGVNYYLDGHDVKWTTDIGFGINRVSRGWATQSGAEATAWRADFPDSDARPQIVFRTQFQLLF